MKLISWNVNGLRACLNKGFMDYFKSMDADILCLQETKMQEGQAEIYLEGYYQYWNSAVKKGYSGTVIFTKKKPLSVQLGIGVEEYDCEGRAITLEFEDFYMVTAYVPNAQRDLARLPFRLKWEDLFREYLLELDSKKPVIVCGDLNVAHQEIDIKNAKSNRGNSGFTDEEREKMTALLSSGFIDSFRYFYPDREGAYTWWSYMGNVRARNVGWRIDYFIVSERLKDRLEDASIDAHILGSDHCPIVLHLTD